MRKAILILLLTPALLASYRPSVLPVTSFDLDGAYTVLACNAGYRAASGTSDTIVTLPAAAACTGQTVMISDSMSLGAAAWISVAPAGGESISGFAVGQRLLLPRPGVALTLVSDGVNWSCVRGSAACVVDPRTVTGLSGWWDASRGLTLDAAAGRVTAWADQSGGGHDLAEVSSSGPAVSMGVNGLTALTFNGVDDYLRSTAALQLASTTVTVAAVWTDGASDNTARTLFATDFAPAAGLALTSDGTTDQLVLDGRWAAASVVLTAETATTSTRGSLAVYATRLQSVVGRVGAVADAIWAGGTLGIVSTTAVSAAQPPMTDGYWYIGQGHYGNADGRWFAGLVQSVLVWDASVPDADIARVREFIRRRHF